MGIITPTENRILTDFDLGKEIPWELLLQLRIEFWPILT